MILSVLLSRAIRVLCLSGAVLGMTAAVAHENTVTLESDGAGWAENVAAYSVPETAVGNGTERPDLSDPQIEVDNYKDQAMESYNFPEGEIGNGTYPPRVNP